LQRCALTFHRCKGKSGSENGFGNELHDGCLYDLGLLDWIDRLLSKVMEIDFMGKGFRTDTNPRQAAFWTELHREWQQDFGRRSVKCTDAARGTRESN